MSIILPGLTDIVVVVHGIGDQKRNATVRSVANRLAESKALRGATSPVAPQPLGYFHSDIRRLVEARLIDDGGRLSGASLASIGVAEVFWADIPQDVVKEGRTMEETKAWARTVVARAKALCEDAKVANPADLVPPDFTLAAEVLDEMIEAIYVLENLCKIADKAGVFTFDLREMLEEFLGDVQVVAEFGYYRTDIVGRFHRAMEDIFEEHREKDPNKKEQLRLHIVAHSEGTVVSFLGLLHAMSGHQVKPADDTGANATVDPGAGRPKWLDRVAGYMTIGSPIDKHLLLWPRMWQGLAPSLANETFSSQPIKWRNYYDYGDPVGFRLDTARLWLGPRMMGVTAFEFEDHHDHGFARYMLPGKAHNDYWDDDAVFEHFITEVVKPQPKPAPPPHTRPLVALFSPSLPYILSFLVLMLGTYLLYKQVSEFVHPSRGALEAIQISRDLGIELSACVTGPALLRHVLGVASLVAGASLLARLPRMARGVKWKALALLGFAGGCIAYWQLITPVSRHEIGAPFARFGPHGPTAGVCLLAAAVGAVGWLATLGGKADRKKRWLWQGMRPLILCGALGVSLIVLGRLYPDKFGASVPLAPEEQGFVDEYSSSHAPETKETLQCAFVAARLTRAELNQLFARGADGALDREASRRHLDNFAVTAPLLAQRPPVWPVVLATAAFLYLWWLGALLFDMSFVWQRYVRESVTNHRLHDWYHRKHLREPAPPRAKSRPNT